MSVTLDQLFEGASELPEWERESWLRARCGGDEHLVSRVLTLLRADSDAGSASFLEAPPVDAIADAVGSLSDAIESGRPEGVGPYEIERLLGSGGMGEVYLARRVGGDFEQRVAIKLLRGLPTRELIERFGRERRVLASLAHPNIASLIDGGETEQGAPYLVMPYVEGEPIDAHCRSRGLGVREAVELLLPVLDAVGHAHRRLVVHRDLKPANVLVDAEGRPMVLDFGIAKILGDPGADVTGTGRQLLTPMYASPEQVRDEPISTAADVFSLGVMLYELLTGAHPWGSDRPGPVELARRICETDPPPPGGAKASGTTEARQSQRALWADLDAIVMTALRKEPERRYPSVDRFADDLRRALDGRAVTARPDTISYRASRFVRRHRVAVGGVAIAALALLGGTVVSLWQAGRADAASERYLEQLTMTETRNAQLRDLTTTLVFDVYDSVSRLDGANPARLTLLESGVTYLDELAQQIGDDPKLAIDLISGYIRLADVQGLRTVGSVGDTAGAMESSAKALAIAHRLQTMPGAPRDAPVLLAMAQRTQGDLLKATGRFEDALRVYSDGLDAVDRAIARFPDNARVHRYAIGLGLQRGSLERRMGRPGDALVSYESAMESIRRVLAIRPDDVETRRDLAIALRRMGDLLLADGRVTEAQPMFSEGMEIFAEFRDADPGNRQHVSSLAIQYERLGDCALRLGDLGEARDRYDSAYRIVEKESQQNPDDMLALERLSIAMEKLADVSEAAGELTAAADWAERSSNLARKVSGSDSENRASYLDALYIRGKAARMAAAAGRDAADHLGAVAEEARLAAVDSDGDAYPIEIEINARVALLAVAPESSAELRAALGRYAGGFAGSSWYRDAVEALEEHQAD